MRTVKSNLIKMLTIALVVCLGVFVALIPMTKSPVNADEISFSITGEDMNGAQKGLQFVGSLTGTPDEYGILVYPAGETAIDDTLDVKANEEALDALNFINQKSAAICFNRDTMLTWESVTPDNVDAILANFYAKDFTATPYYVAGGETFYGESYTSNMLTVAQAHVDAKDSTEQKLAQQILGYDIVENAEIEGSIDFAGREDGYRYPAAIYVNGTEVFNVGEDGTDGETTSISLVEYVTAKTTPSNVLDIRFVLEGEEMDEETGYYLTKTVCYNDVTYWTSIISNVEELSAALSYTGVNSLNNYGFYKMDANITLTENLPITYYSGTTNKDGGKGFCGQFDGDGHYIDFASFKTTTANTLGSEKPCGLFGDFAYKYSASATGEQPKAQVTVKNLAVLNFPSGKNDYVFGRYSMAHGYSKEGTPHFENIYVNYVSSSYTSGALLRMPGVVTMKNVFVDATKHHNNTVGTHKEYNGGVQGTAFYRGPAANHTHSNNYGGGSLFQSLTYFKNAQSSFDNVISIGKTPLAFNSEQTWWDSQRGSIVSTLNPDGTYTHSIDNNKNYTQLYNLSIAYAGNQTKGDVAVRLSIKDKFLNLEGVNKNPGHNLAGAYCTTCYDEFSLVTDGSAKCPTCDVAMTVVTSDTGKDMWALPAIYNWGVETDLDNLAPIKVGGSVKLVGTAKYATLADLSDTFLNKDASVYDAFLGEEGNGMWKVNANGELTWGALVSESYVFTEMDFDASTGEIISTDLPSYDEITSIVANGNELTKENGGIIKTETGFKLNVLASGATETNGVPYVDAKNSASNMVTMKVSTAEDTVAYANVRYWTSIISDADELKAALDFDYTSVKYNYGFYAMDADVDMTGVSFAYTGFAAGNINVEIGFGGQFDGRGYAIANANTGLANGLFGNFVYSGGSANAPKAHVTIKNLEVSNWGINNAPVFGKYTSNHNYHANASITIENVYVTYKSAAVVDGLINTPGTASTKMNNVVVVNPATTANTTEAIFGEGNANAIYEKKPFYAEGTLFGSLRFYGTTTQSNINNVISISKSPLIYQTADFSDWSANVTATIYPAHFTNTVEGGVYTHTPRATGWSTDQATLPTIQYNGTNEFYVGYAGNETVGNVLKISGIRPSFAAIAATSDGSAVAGFYCKNCYDFYSLEAGNCPTCVVDEAPVALTESANLWTVLGVYTYTRTNLVGYVNPATTKGNGEVVFTGASKYVDNAALKTAYEADNSIYASFLGVDGNGMWSVVDGVLTWVGAAA